MSRRRPDRDTTLQRHLRLNEADQAAALRAMFGEPEPLDDDDDLDDLERAARLTLHGSKGVPQSRGTHDLARRLDVLERQHRQHATFIQELAQSLCTMSQENLEHNRALRELLLRLVSVKGGAQ